MQLDKTEIVIRQRTQLELLDLSLLVIRRYWRLLLGGSALFGLPLLALNVLLTRWMLGEQGRFAMAELAEPEAAMQQRYLLHMVALWYLEFPLASLPATILIGNQIFFERLNFRQLLERLKPILWRACLVLGILRMGLVALPLEVLVDADVPFGMSVEFFGLLVLCVGWATFRRMGKPFAPEILGLEGCKLKTKAKNELSYWRRTASLHDPISGECFGRFLTCAAVVTALVMSLYSLTFVGDFVGLRQSRLQVFNAMLSNQMLVQVMFPLAMWLGGIYATVFRFLSYIDARIRLEGWEVELQLKAERARLLQSLSPVLDDQTAASEAALDEVGQNLPPADDFPVAKLVGDLPLGGTPVSEGPRA
ncbi:MAG: hypothetical protein ACTHOU_09920 [Aureliella sp.]